MIRKVAAMRVKIGVGELEQVAMYHLVLFFN